MAAFCERPSVLIPHTSNCKRGSVCCDNTRSVTTTPRPRPTIQQQQTTSTTTTVDPRPECPGSCIVSYLSFTCFRKLINFLIKYFIIDYNVGNAEMTEIFKCRKPGTKCCAPKSLIREALGQKPENISIIKSTTEQTTSSFFTTSWTINNNVSIPASK